MWPVSPNRKLRRPRSNAGRRPSSFGSACLVLLLGLLGLTGAEAASLKLCFKDVPPDATEVRGYVGSLLLGQLLPGQSQVDGSVCAIVSPLPPAIIPGTAQQYSLRAANAAGQESPPSNGLTFRYPTVPTSPTLVSVGASAP